MSEENNNQQENLPKIVKAAPELLPLWDWWVKEGKSTVTMLLVAAVVVAGFYAGRNWLRNRDAAANNALVNAYTTEELETAVSDFGSTKVAPALRMRLAKSYYDAGRFQEALDVYDALVAKSSKNEAFADIAVVGRAYALEGLEKFDEAAAAFDAYAKGTTNSYLTLTAQLGAIRCIALKGDKDAAAKAFDELKAATTDEMAKARIERMADAVKRHDPSRAARSLFDAANAAAAVVEAAAKAEAPKAEVKAEAKAEAPKAEKKAEAPKAEAAKPAEKKPEEKK